VSGYFRRLSCGVVGLIVTSGGGGVGANPARADELVMPFACSVERGGVRLQRAPETSFRVFGPHDEQPFVSCTGSECISTMVHRFAISCGGEKTAWARVAAAGRKSGVELPAGLPEGFAPVAPFQGRFVLPALTRFGARNDSVAMEQLSADSVVDRSADREPLSLSGASPWQTHVQAEYRPEASSDARRTFLLAGGLLLLMFSAGAIFARPSSFATIVIGPKAPWLSLWHVLLKLWERVKAGLVLLGPSEATMGEADAHLLNALAIANARLAETEMLIALLPRELLLREVLESETERVRSRLSSLGNGYRRLPAGKGGAVIRAAMRELERIARIAEGAARDRGSAPMRPDDDIPSTLPEAYRILGVNGDASPQAVKKMVDALRVNWHPDLAKSDDDRARREVRMKQVNAAWDLIREQVAGPPEVERRSKPGPARRGFPAESGRRRQ